MGVEMTYTREGSFGVVGVNGYAVCRKGETVEVDDADVPGLEAQGFSRGGGDATADDAASEAASDERGADSEGDGGRSAVVDEEVSPEARFLEELGQADKPRLVEIGRALDLNFDARWGARKLRKVIREALEG